MKKFIDLCLFSIAIMLENFVVTRGLIKFAINPQGKIMDVANRLGMSGIAGQQGTTRILYDSLPLDGRTWYEFFKDSQNRQFPYTNTGSFGNKLEQGETLSILYAHFSIFTVANNLISSILPLQYIIYPSIALGDLSLEIANSTVMKPIPVLNFLPDWNKDAKFCTDGVQNYDGYSVMNFNTVLVIPPLMDFIFKLQLNNGVTESHAYLRFTIEGVGSILNTRQTF